MHLLTVIENKE